MKSVRDAYLPERGSVDVGVRRARPSLAALGRDAARAGCAVGPAYQVPSAATPAAFKEAPAADAIWLPAAPADALDRGDWWTLFGDPDLDRLAAQVTVSNQNVAAAVAAYAQAQALVREQRAALFPTLGLDASARRIGGRGSATHRRTPIRPASLRGWEPDLWGRLRSGVEAAQRRRGRERRPISPPARLSAQAELAINYFSLREADAEIGLLRSTVEGYERALQITQNRYAAGVIAKTDVLQAQTQLANTRADLASLQGQRARLEHAIAVLVGQAPGDFALAPAPWRSSVPAVPLGVPSLLLQRRPDIAAAERDVAAANAQIGIQRSAYFPSISLSGALGAAGASVARSVQRVRCAVVARRVRRADLVRCRRDRRPRRRGRGGSRCGDRALSADGADGVPGGRGPARDDAACWSSRKRCVEQASAAADATEAADPEPLPGRPAQLHRGRHGAGRRR